MTPNELYARTAESTDHEVGVLQGCYFNHIPEMNDNSIPWIDPNGRVQIRCYKFFSFDGRRYWRLASVWYESNTRWKPFMIIQNAGREGDDHHKRFVTDREVYDEALKYLRTIAMWNYPDETTKDMVDPTQDVASLTEFYGNMLDGHFERARY